MNRKAESYIQEVLHNMLAPRDKKQRIEADLRAHFLEAEAAGQQADAVIGRLGTPAELAAEMMSQVKLVYAPYWCRAAAFLLDILIVMAAGALYFGVLLVLGAELTCGVDPGLRVNSPVALAFAVLGGIAFGGVFLLYFPLAEARFGRTPGKAALGLRVVRENGLPIGYKEAFLRRLSFFFNIFWLDAIFVFFTEKRQRAFDIIAKTVVIREP